MKRLTIVASLCLFGLIGAAAVSTAEQMIAPHKVTIPLTFRQTDLFATLYARDPNRAKKTSGTAGNIDSLSFCKLGTGGKDTTAAILVPSSGLIKGSAAAADTNQVFARVCFWPVNVNNTTAWTTSVADSLYLVTQVSADGTVWENTGTVINVAGTGFAAAAINTAGVAMILSATGGTGTVLFTDQPASRTVPYIGGLSSWPAIRFIIGHSVAGETGAGQNFSGNITFFSASDNPNK